MLGLAEDVNGVEDRRVDPADVFDNLSISVVLVSAAELASYVVGNDSV